MLSHFILALSFLAIFIECRPEKNNNKLETTTFETYDYQELSEDTTTVGDLTDYSDSGPECHVEREKIVDCTITMNNGTSNEYGDKGCPEGNWICMKQAESEFYQDQNSKLWIKKGYCVPKICKRHSDCTVGDYCNGGRIVRGISCIKDKEKGEPHCIYGTHHILDDMGLYIDQFDKNDPIGNCEKARQTGCPAGMRCRYMHDFIGMRCVDENYDSLEDDMNEYDIYEDRESHSQEGEITDPLKEKVESKMNTILEKVLEKLKLSQNVELKAHEMIEDILDEEGSGSGFGDDEDY